jgi:hypothetical protein
MMLSMRVKGEIDRWSVGPRKFWGMGNVGGREKEDEFVGKIGKGTNTG